MKLKRGGHRLWVIAVSWLAVTGLLLLQFWPHLPGTPGRWALLLLLGPPVWLLGEALFERIFSSRHGAALSARRFSPLRVVLALAVGLAVFAAGQWVGYLVAQ